MKIKIKMIKICLIVLLGIFVFGLTASPSYAGFFFDNFDDGNADGWWLGIYNDIPSSYANWRIEDGMLVQDSGYDGSVALVESFQIPSQTVETDLKLNGPSGNCGIIIWLQDRYNSAAIGVSNGAIGVSEVEDGIWHVDNYPFAFNINENRWVTLKVEVNSTDGKLDIYADGIHLFTHQLTTSNRIGQTGVISGNAGGYFDNFSIASDSIVDPLTDKAKCKNDGWKLFSNPTFKNQGACVSYFESNENAGKRN